MLNLKEIIFKLNIIFTHAVGTFDIRENFDLALPADRPARGETANITIDLDPGKFVLNLTP